MFVLNNHLTLTKHIGEMRKGSVESGTSADVCFDDTTTQSTNDSVHASSTSNRRTSCSDSSSMVSELARARLEIEELKFQIDMHEKEMRLERDIACEGAQERIRELQDQVARLSTRTSPSDDACWEVVKDEVQDMEKFMQQMLAAQLPAAMYDPEGTRRGEASPREAQTVEWAALSTFLLNLDATCRALVQRLEDSERESLEKSTQINALREKNHRLAQLVDTSLNRNGAAPVRTRHIIKRSNTPAPMPSAILVNSSADARYICMSPPAPQSMDRACATSTPAALRPLQRSSTISTLPELSRSISRGFSKLFGVA
eukprot:GEMP01052191.1.p1 GENE.GEMP01052191.1~~GEMP01052191.1.p1  ORF type:complete len:315 (+),score=58.26 GEMP01052191.1:69-1013(+)